MKDSNQVVRRPSTFSKVARHLRKKVLPLAIMAGCGHSAWADVQAVVTPDNFQKTVNAQGFQSTLMMKSIAVLSGESALHQSAIMRGATEIQLTPKQVALLEHYGSAIDALANSEMLTLEEVISIAAEFGITIESKNQLATDKGVRLFGVAFDQPLEGQPDILLEQDLAGNSQVLQAVALSEIGELADARIFNIKEGDFGLTLLCSLYGYQDELTGVQNRFIQHDDIVEVAGREGQSMVDAATGHLLEATAFMDDASDTMSGISTTTFLTSTSEHAFTNFSDYIEENDKRLMLTMAELSQAAECHARFYRVFRARWEQEYGEHTPDYDRLPNLRRVDSVVGVDSYDLRDFQRESTHFANNALITFDQYALGAIKLAVGTVAELGRQSANFYQQERQQRLQNTMSIISLTAGGLSMVNSLSSVASAVQVIGVASNLGNLSSDLSGAVSDSMSFLGDAIDFASAWGAEQDQSYDWGVEVEEVSDPTNFNQVVQYRGERLNHTMKRASLMYRRHPEADSSFGAQLSDSIAILAEALDRSSVTVQQMLLLAPMQEVFIELNTAEMPEVLTASVNLLRETGLTVLLGEARTDFNTDFYQGVDYGPSNRTESYRFSLEAHSVGFRRNDKHGTCTKFWGRGLVEYTSDNKIGLTNKHKARVDDFLHSPDRLLNIIKGKACSAVANQSLQEATDYYSGSRR